MKLGLLLLLTVVLAAHVAVCGANTSSTFCCAIEVKPITVTMFRLKTVKDKKIIEKKGTRMVLCGEQSKRIWCTEYYIKQRGIIPFYAMKKVPEEVEQKQPCPSEHVICCEGFTKYGENCYGTEELEEVKKLEGLGLPISLIG